MFTQSNILSAGKIHGFTAVEFMVVLGLSALFLVAAVPGYQALIQNNKIVAATNRLSASLNLARTEAIRRSTKVSVCPTANAAFTACGSTAQWGSGWIVFVDSDNDNVIDSSADLVKVADAPATGTKITSASAIISYDATGFLLSGATSLVVQTTGCSGNNARTISISGAGRVSITYSACS